MSLTVFYFVVLAAQMLASIGVLSINAWMVNALVNAGYIVTDDNKWLWVSFYALMTMAFISIIVPFIQGLCMGCLCCGGCVKRPLSTGHYVAQAIFLVLQVAAWIAAAGWGTSVLLFNDVTIQTFGNIRYLAITCSWLAPFFAIVMIVIVMRLRAARIKADTEAHHHHAKNDV